MLDSILPDFYLHTFGDLTYCWSYRNNKLGECLTRRYFFIPHAVVFYSERYDVSRFAQFR